MPIFEAEIHLVHIDSGDEGESTALSFDNGDDYKNPNDNWVDLYITTNDYDFLERINQINIARKKHERIKYKITIEKINNKNKNKNKNKNNLNKNNLNKNKNIIHDGIVRGVS